MSVTQPSGVARATFEAAVLARTLGSAAFGVALASFAGDDADAVAALGEAADGALGGTEPGFVWPHAKATTTTAKRLGTRCIRGNNTTDP
jgi:hypothetical protein